MVYLLGKRGGLMIHLPGNEDAWVIVSYKWLLWWLSKNKNLIAEFLTKTEQKMNKNTQNKLLDGCHLLFEEYLQQEQLFIS